MSHRNCISSEVTPHVRPKDQTGKVLFAVPSGDNDEEATEGANASSSTSRGNEEDEQAMQDDEVSEEAEEAADMVQKPTPVAVSKIEAERHYDRNHAEYRSWCESCVAGRGVATPHKRKGKSKNGESEIPKICMDYCFPRGMAPDAPKVVRIRSANCGTTLSLVVP